jgi:hypothetical protein
MAMAMAMQTARATTLAQALCTWLLIMQTAQAVASAPAVQVRDVVIIGSGPAGAQSEAPHV